MGRRHPVHPALRDLHEPVLGGLDEPDRDPVEQRVEVQGGPGLELGEHRLGKRGVPRLAAIGGHLPKLGGADEQQALAPAPLEGELVQARIARPAALPSTLAKRVGAARVHDDHRGVGATGRVHHAVQRPRVR